MRRARKDFKALLEPKAHRVIKAFKGLKVLKVMLALRDFKAFRVLKALLEPKVLPVLLELKAQRGHRVSKDSKGTWGRKGLKVLKVP